MKITQLQFVEGVAAKCSITSSLAKIIIDEFKKFIYAELGAGNSVELSGFGQFSVKHRNSREGVNPRTKERITIPEFNTPKFKAGEVFKQAVALKK